MNFNWSKTQTEHYRRAVEFAKTQLNDDVMARDAAGEFAEPLWRRCAEFGVFRSHVPECFGGSGEIDLLTSVIEMQALGYGCPDQGLLLALNVQLWSVISPILQLGSDKQKSGLLPRLCSGEWKGAHALTEPEAGSDLSNLTTTALRTDDGYELSGTKCMVSLAPIADVFLVTALTLPDRNFATFVLPKMIDGLHVEAADSKMGLRTVPFGSLTLKKCFVMSEAMLGTENAGQRVLQSLLELERCCILAGHVGMLDRQLDRTLSYARKRRQFDRPIGDFQSVSNRIADMKLRLETCKLLLYHVASLKASGRNATAEAAMLKLHLSESSVESSLDAMRVFGGRGYMTEFGVERELRDSVGGLFYAGTSDIQRNIIAGMLGVGR